MFHFLFGFRALCSVAVCATRTRCRLLCVLLLHICPGKIEILAFDARISFLFAFACTNANTVQIYTVAWKALHRWMVFAQYLNLICSRKLWDKSPLETLRLSSAQQMASAHLRLVCHLQMLTRAEKFFCVGFDFCNKLRDHGDHLLISCKLPYHYHRSIKQFVIFLGFLGFSLIESKMQYE